MTTTSFLRSAVSTWGQKLYFWAMIFSTILLLLSGVVLWYVDDVPWKFHILRYVAILIHCQRRTDHHRAFPDSRLHEHGFGVGKFRNHDSRNSHPRLVVDVSSQMVLRGNRPIPTQAMIPGKVGSPHHRANELTSTCPFAAEGLRFYARVATFQKRLYCDNPQRARGFAKEFGGKTPARRIGFNSASFLIFLHFYR